MKEEWKAITGYPNYIVSNLGRVISIRRKKLLSPFPDKDGYSMVGIYNGGLRRGFRVHRLVAMAFIPNPDGKPEVNHKNAIKTSNYVGNLEWSTSIENIEHAYNASLYKRGEKRWNARLMEVDVIEIKRRLSMGEKNIVLAKEYGVHKVTISQIKCGRSWAHIPS